jgi:hypothetical protein
MKEKLSAAVIIEKRERVDFDTLRSISHHSSHPVGRRRNASTLWRRELLGFSTVACYWRFGAQPIVSMVRHAGDFQIGDCRFIEVTSPFFDSRIGAVGISTIPDGIFPWFTTQLLYSPCRYRKRSSATPGRTSASDAWSNATDHFASIFQAAPTPQTAIMIAACVYQQPLRFRPRKQLLHQQRPARIDVDRHL